METVTSTSEFAADPIDTIQHYLDVISTSDDAREVRTVDNLYKDIFDTDPPGTKSWEDSTRRVEFLLDDEAQQETEAKLREIYESASNEQRVVFESPKIDAAAELPYARIGAITHLVRSMIQGNNNFPISQFEDVISRAINAIQAVDPSIDVDAARGFVRAEVKDVWEPFKLQEPQEYDRAAEAYKLVSSPARYRATRVGMAVLKRVTIT